MWNLLVGLHVQYICLQKEVVLQSALRYNFDLFNFSPARISEFDGKISLPVDAFPKKYFPDKETIFRQSTIQWASGPLSSSLATTALLSRS